MVETIDIDGEPYPFSEELQRQSQSLANYYIGFLRMGMVEGERRYVPAGSGTLVEIEGIRGVLTAGHVAQQLSESVDPLGIMSVSRQKAIQSRKFEPKEGRFIWIGTKPWQNAEQPDLGFVRLPHEVESSLAATNVFLNFNARVAAYNRGEKPSAERAAALTGFVAEFTDHVPSNGRFQESTLTSLITAGTLRNLRTRNGFEFFDYHPIQVGLTRKATDYRGMSGGAVWSLGKGQSVQDKQIIGIASFQKEEPDGSMTIVCQGRDSMYRYLLPRVLEEFAKP